MRHFYIIETRYHGPTNHRGARVSAKRADGYGRRVSIPWDHARSSFDNHRHAADILRNDYDGHVFAGSADIGSGFAFIVDPLAFV